MNVSTADRKPPLVVRRARALKRELCWRFSSVLPVILAAEFPKSGGTWISQMVATAAGYRFPRNNLDPHFLRTVLLGHHTYSRTYNHVFVIFRDGRDVMVSAYHHFLYENEWNDPQTVRSTRQELGYTDNDQPYAKFSEFVEWMFTGYCRRITRFSWSQFVNSWLDIDVPKVFYEDMLSQPVFELQRLCQGLGLDVHERRFEEIVEANSFKAKSSSSPTRRDVGSFVRKGIAGDWKNVFDPKSAEIFNHFAGKELVALGYEQDDRWTDLSGDENR